jgi:xanthine phosphoribosyltransferase
LGLADIVHQAGAKLAGIAVAIEKQFQGGGNRLKEKGYRLESLAIIESIVEGKINFA